MKPSDEAVRAGTDIAQLSMFGVEITATRAAIGVQSAIDEHEVDLVEVLRELLRWSELAYQKMLGASLRESIDGNPAWKRARAAIAKREASASNEPNEGTE